MVTEAGNASDGITSLNSSLKIVPPVLSTLRFSVGSVSPGSVSPGSSPPGFSSSGGLVLPVSSGISIFSSGSEQLLTETTSNNTKSTYRKWLITFFMLDKILWNGSIVLNFGTVKEGKISLNRTNKRYTILYKT